MERPDKPNDRTMIYSLTTIDLTGTILEANWTHYRSTITIIYCSAVRAVKLLIYSLSVLSVYSFRCVILRVTL